MFCSNPAKPDRLMADRKVIQHIVSPQAVQSWCDSARENNKTIGFVATMGALHPGHISLVSRAREENDIVIASIFVNPLQFDRAEDLQKYPRDEASDIRLLDTAGVQMVFTGSPDDFLGDIQYKSTQELTDPGIYARGLEGTYRPGHFAGVREIVSRLFEFVGPCRAYFGEKDYQQVQVIKQLASCLTGINVIACSTSRESSGLARSSRNLRLSEQGTHDASVIFEAMLAADVSWKQGVRSPKVLQHAMLEVLNKSGINLEYAEVRDPLNWTESQTENDISRARAFIAGNLEGVRLIDNMALES
jgi:pantoate--beta-alanine ligase